MTLNVVFCSATFMCILLQKEKPPRVLTLFSAELISFAPTTDDITFLVELTDSSADPAGLE